MRESSTPLLVGTRVGWNELAEGGREGGWVEGRGGREEGRERGREERRERGREGGREEGKEEGKESEQVKCIYYSSQPTCYIQMKWYNSVCCGMAMYTLTVFTCGDRTDVWN